MVRSSNAGGVTSQQEKAPHAAAPREAARPAGAESSPGTLSRAFLQLQRTAGNHSVEALLRRSGGNVSYQAPVGPLAIVQRAVGSSVSSARIQRQAPGEPGPNVGPYVPQLPLPPIVSFGGTLDPNFVPGSPYVKGQNIPGLGSTPNIPLDPTQIPGQIQGLLPKPAGGPAPGGPVGPDSCAPGMYNKLWQKCCPDGTQADAGGTNCVPVAGPALPALPPVPPAETGDFPTPDPDADTQVA